ncbi:MAG: hypothetical protein V4629_07280 [Pseudomonadota bacterium]
MGSGYDFGTSFGGGSSNPYNPTLPTGDEIINKFGRANTDHADDIADDGIADTFTYVDPASGQTVTVTGELKTDASSGLTFVDVNGDGILNGGDVIVTSAGDVYQIPPNAVITESEFGTWYIDTNPLDEDGFTQGEDVYLVTDNEGNSYISHYSCWKDANGNIWAINNGTVTITPEADLKEGGDLIAEGQVYKYNKATAAFVLFTDGSWNGQTRAFNGALYVWDDKGKQWVVATAENEAAIAAIFGFTDGELPWGFLLVADPAPGETNGQIYIWDDTGGEQGFEAALAHVDANGNIVNDGPYSDGIIYKSRDLDQMLELEDGTADNLTLQYHKEYKEKFLWATNYYWDRSDSAYKSSSGDCRFGVDEMQDGTQYGGYIANSRDPTSAENPIFFTEHGPKTQAEIDELAAQGIYYDSVTGQRIDGDFLLSLEEGASVTTLGHSPITFTRQGNEFVDSDGAKVGWAITGPDGQSIFNIFAPEDYVPPPTVISENGVTYVLQNGEYVTLEQALINDPDGTFDTGFGTTITISQGETSANLPIYTITEDVPASADGNIPAAQNVWVDITRKDGSHELIADEFFVDLTGDRYLGADGAWHTLSETVQGFAGAGGEIPLAGGLMLTVETDAAGYTAMYVVSPNGASENFAGAYSPGGGYSELGVFYGGEDSEGNPQWKVLDKNGNWVTLTQEVDAEGNLVGVPVESIDGNTYELNGNAVSGITAEGKGFEVREKFGYIIASGSEGAPDGIVGSVRPPDKPGSMNMYRLMAGFFVFMDKLSEALETIKNALEAIAAQERALGIVETRVTDDASQGHTTTSAEIAKEFETLTPQELQALEDKGWITVDSDGNITLTTEGEAAFGFEGGYAMTGDAVGEGVHLDLTTFNTSINNTKNDISGDRKILENELTQNTTLYTTVFSKNVSELISRFDMKDDIRL